MQSTVNKFNFAVWALLAVILCFLSLRPANAVTFNFSASCDTCVLPLALPGSPVAGELVLTDALLDGGVVTPSGSFTFEAIESFTLTFQISGFPLPSPDPAIFNSIELGIGGFLDPFGGPTTGLAGMFNSAGNGIQTMAIADALDQIFEVDFGADGAPGSAFWGVLDQNMQIGEGVPIAFVIPTPAAVPEPATIAVFLFALGSLVFAGRRRQVVRFRSVSAVR